jgi:hypothetical protein
MMTIARCNPVDGAVAGAAPAGLDVGSAVRVVIAQEQTCPGCRHFTGETGRTGRVVAVRPTKHAPSHPYLVMLDHATPGDARLTSRLAIVARHYAAEELERADA